MEQGSRGIILNGSILILGTVIGAVIAGFAPLILQSEQNARENEQTRQDVRGAARILFAELLDSGTQMQILANDRILRPFDPAYDLEVRPEDLRLVASHISAERWGHVQAAMTRVQGLKTFVNTQLERGRNRLTVGEACYALLDLRAVYWAAWSLTDLADAASREPPPEDPPCVPEPGPVPAGIVPGG